MPFEEAMTSLGNFFRSTNLFQQFVFATKIRFDCLIYRCKLVALEESCQMLKPILEMGLRSQHTAVLAQGLKHVTIPRLASQLHGVRESIQACEVKGLRRLEVELRLIQLASEVAMDHIGLRSSLGGADTELSSIVKLCDRFPQTAGMLLPSCQKIGTFLRYDKYANGHPLFTKATQKAWWTWDKHGTGDLKTCEKMHPYSGNTMEHCPECGPEVGHKKLRETSGNLVISPQDFIAAMKARNFDGSSYHTAR